MAELPVPPDGSTSEVDRRRSSPGGHVVARSVEAAGFTHLASVALVETVKPTLRPARVVLSQNAWNYLPRAEFATLAGAYPPRHRLLYRARRGMARVNSRRTAHNVALTDYMGDLVRSTGVECSVVPVTLPWDMSGGRLPAAVAVAGVDRPFVVVPGTFTWYKDAHYALDLLEMIPAPERPLIVLAGTDDDSGCHDDLRARLAARSLEHWMGPVNRGEMAWLLREATATVIPSRLESLSFSLAEALVLSRRVLASPLPVHLEVAQRLGRAPLWLTERPTAEMAAALVGEPADMPSVSTLPYDDEWVLLAEKLTEWGADA